MTPRRPFSVLSVSLMLLGGVACESSGAKGTASALATDGGGSDAGASEDAGPLPIAKEKLAVMGCHVDRPGFAYVAGKSASTLTAPPGGRAPIPCATLTDQGSAEASLVVAGDGAVYYAPVFQADGAGLLKSTDQGVTWKLAVPKWSGGQGHGRTQPYTYLDPATNRLFFATSTLTFGAATRPNTTQQGFNLTYSSDGGDTWSFTHFTNGGLDWIKIFAGPPVTSTPVGYPNVLYISGPSPTSTPLLGLKPDHQSVSRSLDGGATWEEVATLSTKPADVPGCDPNEWIIYGAAAAAKDGSLYQVLRQCTHLAVSMSKDEGKTWTTATIPGGDYPPFDTTDIVSIVQNPNVLPTELLTVDSDGNVYVVWVDTAGALRLVYSKDHAKTGSSSVVVGAPSVKKVVYAGIATSGPGTVAIAYHGSTDGLRLDGYVTETTNAFDAAPVFSSVTIDDPADPLYPNGFQSGYLGLLRGGDLNEIIHVKYAPNGDLWASFEKGMCRGGDTSDCQWDAAAHQGSVYQGVVGHVIHGVAPRWGSAPSAPVKADAGKACDPTDTSGAALCLQQSKDVGICDALATCACDHCACESKICYLDATCAKIVACAVKSNCRGLDCMQPCGDLIVPAGDTLTSLALEVSECSRRNQCPATCP